MTFSAGACSACVYQVMDARGKSGEHGIHLDKHRKNEFSKHQLCLIWSIKMFSGETNSDVIALYGARLVIRIIGIWNTFNHSSVRYFGICYKHNIATLCTALCLKVLYPQMSLLFICLWRAELQIQTTQDYATDKWFWNLFTGVYNIGPLCCSNHELTTFNPFAPKRRVINVKVPWSLTRNITSHSMKKLAFHSLLRLNNMIILLILTASLITISKTKVGRIYF